MFLFKAFSMSEKDIYQTIRVNYYKKHEEWLTDDVDGIALVSTGIETQKIRKFC